MWRQDKDVLEEKWPIIKLFLVFVISAIVIFFFVIFVFLSSSIDMDCDSTKKESDRIVANAFAIHLKQYLDVRAVVIRDIVSSPVVSSTILFQGGNRSALKSFVSRARLLGEDPQLTILDAQGQVSITEVQEQQDFQWTKPLYNITHPSDVYEKSFRIRSGDYPQFELATPIVYGNQIKGLVIARFNADPLMIYSDMLREMPRASFAYSKDGKLISFGQTSFLNDTQPQSFLDDYGVSFIYSSFDNFCEKNKESFLIEVFLTVFLSLFLVFCVLFFLGFHIIFHPLKVLSKTKTVLADKEEMLKSSLDFQSLIFDTIPDSIFVKDKNLCFVQANKAFLNLYPEHLRGSVIGTMSLEGYDQEEAQLFLANDRHAFNEGASEVEEELVFPDGQRRTMLTKKVRFVGHNKELFILGIARDITDIKNTQQALLESEQRYEVSVDGSSIGLWDFDLLTGNLFWSDRFKEIVGVGGDDFMSTIDEFTKRLHPEDKDNTLSILDAHLENKTPYDVEYRFRCENGEYVWLHAKGQAIWDENNSPVRMAGSVEDITYQKNADIERDKLMAKLADSNEELEHFAFVCSHDLQEPLRIIRSFSELLQLHLAETLQHDEKGQRYFNYMIDGAARAQILISDILAYSRIDRDTQPLESVNVMELIDIVKQSLQSNDKNSSANIEYDQLPTVHGNKTQLYQLFQNLINNGIKYQLKDAQPHIYIKVKDLSTHWQFEINDNGIGIDGRYQQQIFEVFKRLHGHGEFAGTGVGLAICRKVVERHGGEIWVDSEKGEGATFYFTLLKNDNNV